MWPSYSKRNISTFNLIRTQPYLSKSSSGTWDQHGYNPWKVTGFKAPMLLEFQTIRGLKNVVSRVKNLPWRPLSRVDFVLWRPDMRLAKKKKCGLQSQKSSLETRYGAWGSMGQKNVVSREDFCSGDWSPGTKSTTNCKLNYKSSSQHYSFLFNMVSLHFNCSEN